MVSKSAGPAAAGEPRYYRSFTAAGTRWIRFIFTTSCSALKSQHVAHVSGLSTRKPSIQQEKKKKTPMCWHYLYSLWVKHSLSWSAPILITFCWDNATTFMEAAGTTSNFFRHLERKHKGNVTYASYELWELHVAATKNVNDIVSLLRCIHNKWAAQPG